MRRIDWLAVTALLLFAAGLRIIGLGFGQPNPDYFPSYAPYGMIHEHLPLHPDEFYSVALPLEMALRNRLNPGFFNYPGMIIYANFAMYRLTGALRDVSLADRAGAELKSYAPFSLYFLSRAYSVFGAMLSVACAYAIARLLSGQFAAICAGLLVAVSFTLVQHAHYIKPGTLAGGWMMLAAWACAASLLSRRAVERRRLYLLAGAVTGLAATTRYNALAVAPLMLLVGALLLLRHRSRSMRLAVILSWLLVPALFLMGSPYILRDFGWFWRDFSYIVGQFTTTGANVADYFLVDHWTGLALLLLYAALFALGIPAMVCAILAVAAAARGFSLKRNSPGLFVALIALMVALYMLVAMRTIRPGHSDNLLLLALPFIAILSAIGADWLVKRLPLPTRLTMPLAALALVIMPLVLSVQVVAIFAQPDTRQVMLRWISDYIPPGARFFLNGPYNVPLDEAIYPSWRQFNVYAAELPSGADYDYMIYSDALAFDVLRSWMTVPAEVIHQQQDYLQHLDANFRRVAWISRPVWTGSEAMINMAAYWHNPTLIVYCLNPASCETRG